MTKHARFLGILIISFCFGEQIQAQLPGDPVDEQWAPYVKMMQRVEKGNQAPNFHYLNDKGDTVSLDDFKGQNVYIDLWATWCGPCIKETPYFDKLKEKYKDENIAFVSISMDDDKEKWERWVQENEMKGHQLFANGKYSKPMFYFTIFDGRTFTPPQPGFGSAIPVFVLIDKAGKIVDNRAPLPSDPNIETALNTLLQEKE